ncbi:MAG: hypothetical protein ACYTGB_20220, partial [Planctomycetota bacterium]
MTARNCIVWGNTASSGAGILNLVGSTATVTYSDVQGGHAGTGNIALDPIFVDAPGGDFHLRSRGGHWTPVGWVTDSQTSPCIDAGDPADAYDNEPEDNGDRINMGAYGNTAQASLAGAAVPQIVFVDDTATGSNTGFSWTDAFTDLQDALAVELPRYEIWVAAGTYKPGTARTDTFRCKYGASVYGGFAGTETARNQRDWTANVCVLSGDIGALGDPSDNSYHVVTGVSGCVISGFTVTGGNANGAGANGRGGGLYSSGQSPSIWDCIFTGNSAGSGGAVCFEGGAPEIYNSRFDGNSATASGGGIARLGGGTVTMYRSILSGNSAVTSGGGVYCAAGSYFRTFNCTLYGNSAASGGGFAAADSWLDVKNSIVWGGAGGQISTSGSLVNVTYSNVQGGYAGTGNIDLEPIFADAPGGDFHLRSRGGRWTPGGWVTDSQNSPCIDAGDPADSFAAEPEDNGDRINMGAYGNTLQASMAGAAGPQIVFVDDTATGSNTGFSWTDAFTDLQDALAVGLPSYEIWVATGTYKPGAARADTFALKSGASIYGGFAGTETARNQRDWTANVCVLSGDIGALGDPSDNSYHVVTGSSGSVISGFTVTGGN